MNHQINGLKDIYKLLMNEGKVGGVIEANALRLRTDEVYQNPIMTQIDLLGSSIYSIGFMTEDYQNIIVNITELSLLQEPKHKKNSRIKQCSLQKNKN